MEYRFYKGEEYYGRDIRYIGSTVLCCSECGYVGTYKDEAEAETAKVKHNKLHTNKAMEVIMVGTPVCPKCTAIAPKLEAYCNDNNILFRRMLLNEAPPAILDILKSNNITQAPAFIIHKDSEDYVISGDSIFVELEKL